MFSHIKRYVVVGLIAILPLWITYFILLAVFNVVVSLARPFITALPFLPESPFLLNLLSFVVTILFVFTRVQRTWWAERFS